MNYPRAYRGGESAFWSGFAFQFDDLELAHLRHGFRNNVIMGGNQFGVGAAFEKERQIMENIRDESGLRVSLKTTRFVQLGMPIHVDISITNVSNSPKQVFKDLHPSNGLVQISLQKPNGKVVDYHPPMSHLILPKVSYLEPGNKIEEIESYIGYDANEGQIFDAPGSYLLFATYYCPDGSAIRSAVTDINVKAPINADEEKMAELMLGEEQGMLFFLEGSNSEFLEAGNDAFEEMKERFADHEFTNFIQITDADKASRTFVQIDAERKIKVQKSDESFAKKLLSSIVEKEPNQPGLQSDSMRLARKHLDVLENNEEVTKVR